MFSKNVSHDAKELEKYENLSEQLPYRKDMIRKLLDEAGFGLSDVDVFVGRGGGLLAIHLLPGRRLQERYNAYRLGEKI